MLCHSVRSWRAPDALSFQTSSVAMENRQKGVPLAVYLSSGSRPSLPTRMTLLTDFAISAPVNSLHPNADGVGPVAAPGSSIVRLQLHWFSETLSQLVAMRRLQAAVDSVRRGRGLSSKGQHYFYRVPGTSARTNRSPLEPVRTSSD